MTTLFVPTRDCQMMVPSDWDSEADESDDSITTTPDRSRLAAVLAYVPLNGMSWDEFKAQSKKEHAGYGKVVEESSTVYREELTASDGTGYRTVRKGADGAHVCAVLAVAKTSADFAQYGPTLKRVVDSMRLK